MASDYADHSLLCRYRRRIIRKSLYQIRFQQNAVAKPHHRRLSWWTGGFYTALQALPQIAMLAEEKFPGTFKVFGLQGGGINIDLINDGLIVKSGSPIKSFSDLEGYTIGHVPAFSGGQLLDT